MLDEVEIVVRSGKGGGGAVGFRREKFVPFGGPDGGDGGRGGDVVIMADSAVSSLLAFKRKRSFRAGDGRGGRNQKRHGRKGEGLVLMVPPGTVVMERAQTGDRNTVADLEHAGERVVVARGGEGGRGNTHFASSTNQAPQLAEKGEAGEEKAVLFELRLIADVGIIGYPNVGKSTLLAAASAARPEIAGYPFTTREPALGVAEVGERSFILAEIPGLIDGAHLGHGLGHDFLRHITRTKMLIHLIDGSSSSPCEDMAKVNAELGLFDPALGQKRQLTVVNKIDLPQVRRRLAEMENDLSAVGVSPLFISAASGEGVSRLLAETLKVLDEVMAAREATVRPPGRVFRPEPKPAPPKVLREGDTFVVLSSELERLIARLDMTGPGGRGQLSKQFERLGVSRVLRRAGVKPGDRVRCGNTEWEWGT